MNLNWGIVISAGGFILTLAGWFISYGRLNQKMEDLKENMETLRAQSKEHYEHFGKLDNLAAAQAQFNEGQKEQTKEIKETLKELMECVRNISRN